MDDSGDIRLNDVIIGLGYDDRAPLNPEDAAILQQINKHFNIEFQNFLQFKMRIDKSERKWDSKS